MLALQLATFPCHCFAIPPRWYLCTSTTRWCDCSCSSSFYVATTPLRLFFFAKGNDCGHGLTLKTGRQKLGQHSTQRTTPKESLPDGHRHHKEGNAGTQASSAYSSALVFLPFVVSSFPFLFFSFKHVLWDRGRLSSVYSHFWQMRAVSGRVSTTHMGFGSTERNWLAWAIMFFVFFFSRAC